MARPAGTDPALKIRRSRIALVAAHAGGWLGVLVAAVGLATSRPARAEDRLAAPVAALVWQATGDDCANGEQIRERVTRLTERRVVLEPEAQSHTIRVTVSEQDSSWQAVISLHDPAGRPLGSREVRARSPSCRTLDVPVALVIATMADGLPEQPSPAEKPKDLESGGAQLGFGAFAAGSAGLEARAGFGMGLELEVAWSVPAAIEASAYAPREHLDELGRGARLWAFHAGLRVCPNLIVGGAVALRMCGTVQAGAEHAEGIGLTESYSAMRPIAFMGLGPSLLLGDPAGFSAQFAVSAAWVFVRARFHWSIEGEPDQTLEGTPFAVMARIGVIGFVP